MPDAHTARPARWYAGSNSTRPPTPSRGGFRSVSSTAGSITSRTTSANSRVTAGITRYRLGVVDLRGSPDDHDARHRGAEAALSLEYPLRLGDLVPGLLRAERRLRPLRGADLDRG